MSFSTVHGGVGVPQEIVDAMVVERIHGNPDTGGDRDCMAFQDQGLSNGFKDSFRDPRNILFARSPFQ